MLVSTSSLIVSQSLEIGQADLPDTNPEALDSVLVYLYTDRYDPLAIIAAGPDSKTNKGILVRPRNDTNSTHKWLCAAGTPATAALDSCDNESITHVLSSAIEVYHLALTSQTEAGPRKHELASWHVSF